MTRTGLEARGLLSELDAASLERLEGLAGELRVMAELELRGEPLSEEQYERIRFYGGELEHLTMAAADTDAEDPFAPRFMDEEPQVAVIADVATDPDYITDGIPDPAVLEVGVGRVHPLFVVVPIIEQDGTSYLQVAKGGVFSYYEFVWPAQDRLTDEKWREMLATGQAPPLQDWIDSFYTTEAEHSEIGAGILDFQRSVTLGYWAPEYAAGWDDPALRQLQVELEALVSARQYIAHQLVRTQVRSFDLQSDTLAVVTVRETWDDRLYAHQGDYPGYDEPVLSRRGPYELDVTYTLEAAAAGLNWQVVRVVYANQPPAWQ
jgi:hypothetical protein